MTVPRIRPEIAGNTVPIDSVRPYPGNARRGNLTKLKQSLLAHGQYKELLVQESTGYVLIGNNTLAAMVELGYEHVAVLRLDVDDVRARDMLLIDNASSDTSEYDKAALAELLAGVQDWDGTGWDPGDLDDLLVELARATPDPTPDPAPNNPDTAAGQPWGAPPDLDRLAADVGAPRPEDAWPVIRIGPVPPHLAAAWRTHLAEHAADDVTALAVLLDVDPAAPAPVQWTG